MEFIFKNLYSTSTENDCQQSIMIYNLYTTYTKIIIVTVLDTSKHQFQDRDLELETETKQAY